MTLENKETFSVNTTNANPGKDLYTAETESEIKSPVLDALRSHMEKWYSKKDYVIPVSEEDAA